MCTHGTVLGLLIAVTLVGSISVSVARADADEELEWPSESPPSAERVAVEVGVGIVGAAIGIGSGIAIFESGGRSCTGGWLLEICTRRNVSEAWAVGGTLTLLLPATFVALGHVGNRGRGGAGWMMLGGLAGLAVGGLLGSGVAAAVFGSDPSSARAGAYIGLSLGALAYVIGLVLGIEQSSDDSDPMLTLWPAESGLTVGVSGLL